MFFPSFCIFSFLPCFLLFSLSNKLSLIFRIILLFFHLFHPSSSLLILFLSPFPCRGLMYYLSFPVFFSPIYPQVFLLLSSLLFIPLATDISCNLSYPFSSSLLPSLLSSFILVFRFMFIYLS